MCFLFKSEMSIKACLPPMWLKMYWTAVGKGEDDVIKGRGRDEGVGGGSGVGIAFLYWPLVSLGLCLKRDFHFQMLNVKLQREARKGSKTDGFVLSSLVLCINSRMGFLLEFRDTRISSSLLHECLGHCVSYHYSQKRNTCDISVKQLLST